ncbi:MAG: Fic family protein [Betaproteobacteria bacterium]|nr:Fic family protein [Betaproteobacteria bacterium]
MTAAGLIRLLGQGRATRYVVDSAWSPEDVRRYFEADWQSRPAVGFREELLLSSPGLDPEKAQRLSNLQALARPLDRKFLSDFLIDFSWASSVLEGSTYSNIDTQALIEYGERNPDKPLEDALLILNHKNAIQHLWAHRELSAENLCRIQAFLTDRHGLAEIQDSDHFLPDAQRGVAREFEDVRLGRSAYSPPFRPATGYIAQAFARIIETAATLPAAPAAFYLMTRIAYLQVFANGNKRTSRLAANLPLLQAGMLPISFVVIDRRNGATDDRRNGASLKR